MKNLLLLLFAFLPCGVLAQNVEFNSDRALELKEVVQVDSMSKSDIFVAAQSMLSQWHPNSNSKLAIDYADLATGTIIAKGALCVGFTKVNSLCGYYVNADYNCTIKIKDGRYQVDIKVPTVSLHWSANNSSDESIAVWHVYPVYDKTKTRYYYTKKPLTEQGPKVADTMRMMFTAIKSRIMVNKDDF